MEACYIKKTLQHKCFLKNSAKSLKKYFGEHQITALSVEALSLLINLIENGSLLSIIREAKVCQQKPNAVKDI